MAPNRGRTGPAWNRAVAIVLNREHNCHLCGKPVNKNLSGRYHPLGPQVDHVTPIAKGGALYDLANLRLSHKRCNASKGDKLTQPEPNPGPSRQWLT